MKTILLMAMTADGLTARNSDEFVNWTEKADKNLFVEVTKKSGVVIMGKNTYETIGSPLKNRKNIVLSRKKRGEFPDKNLFFTDADPECLLKDLDNEGFREAVIIGGTEINTVFLRKGLIDELILTICPLFFGKGLTMFNNTTDVSLELIETFKTGDNSVVLRYRIIKD